MKRLIDIFFSALGLIILSPVILITAVVIYLKMGAPIFFTQARAGLNGKEFKMIKFRSMGPEFDKQGNKIPDAQRTGKLGRFLRASSIDELPELWNILIGNMSIVGPRPLLIEYLPYYTQRECKRHHVRPGLTGLAQVSGRNSLDWDTRLAFDVQYVENQSIGLDLKIMLLTIKKVLSRSDVQVITGGQNRLDQVRSKREQNAE